MMPDWKTFLTISIHVSAYFLFCVLLAGLVAYATYEVLQVEKVILSLQSLIGG